MLHVKFWVYNHLRYSVLWCTCLGVDFSVKYSKVKQNETFFCWWNVFYSIFLFSFVPDFRCDVYENACFEVFFFGHDFSFGIMFQRYFSETIGADKSHWRQWPQEGFVYAGLSGDWSQRRGRLRQKQIWSVAYPS